MTQAIKIVMVLAALVVDLVLLAGAWIGWERGDGWLVAAAVFLMFCNGSTVGYYLKLDLHR